MHRSIAIIMLIMVSLYAKAQNFQTITRVVFEQGKISGYNSLNKLAVQVHCGDMVWQVLPDNSIKIWDDIHSFTVFSATLSMPAFAALGDSLRAWQVSCGQSSTPFTTNLDTTHIDTSLILPTLISNFSVNNNDTLSAILQTIKTIDVADTSNLWMINEVYNQLGLINARAYDTSQVDTSMIEPFIIESFSIRNNDTLSAILQKISSISIQDTSNYWLLDSIYNELKSVDTFCLTGALDVEDSIITLLKDTIDFEYHSFCYRSKIDSGVYEFSQLFDVRNPSVPYYMAFVDMDSLLSIFSYMNGTSTGSFPDFAKDYIPCDKWAEYLKRNVASDTLKTLVFKAQTKRIDGTLDTLYNCKGISFNVSANATGNITFYYGDGDQDTYDVASEDLPHWENGSFVEFLGFNASGVSGVVRINMLGCNQTSDAICAKEKPIINCTTTAPIIICSGWGSLSGIWSTISGCWNTGQ